MTEYGPEDVTEGDVVVFEYGERGHTARQEVVRVDEFSVKTVGGGTVHYPLIVDVEKTDPSSTERDQP